VIANATTGFRKNIMLQDNVEREDKSKKVIPL
jgi:hypothetical protein